MMRYILIAKFLIVGLFFASAPASAQSCYTAAQAYTFSCPMVHRFNTDVYYLYSPPGSTSHHGHQCKYTLSGGAQSILDASYRFQQGNDYQSHIANGWITLTTGFYKKGPLCPSVAIFQDTEHLNYVILSDVTPGDFDADQDVDFLDAKIIQTAYNTTNCNYNLDASISCLINLFDLNRHHTLL